MIELTQDKLQSFLGTDFNEPRVIKLFSDLIEMFQETHELQEDLCLEGLIGRHLEQDIPVTLLRCFFLSPDKVLQSGLDINNVSPTNCDENVPGILVYSSDNCDRIVKVPSVFMDVVNSECARLGMFLHNMYFTSTKYKDFIATTFSIARWAIQAYGATESEHIKEILQNVVSYNKFWGNTLALTKSSDYIIYPSLSITGVYNLLRSYLEPSGDISSDKLLDVCSRISQETEFGNRYYISALMDSSKLEEYSISSRFDSVCHTVAWNIFCRLRKNKMVKDIAYIDWDPDAWMMYYIVLATVNGYAV